MGLAPSGDPGVHPVPCPLFPVVQQACLVLPGLKLHRSSLCLPHHLASSWVCSYRTWPLYKDPIVLALGPTLIEYDLILTNHICKELFPNKVTSHVLGVKTSAYLFRGHKSTPQQGVSFLHHLLCARPWAHWRRRGAQTVFAPRERTV